jgi:hypothetical protein
MNLDFDNPDAKTITIVAIVFLVTLVMLWWMTS